MKHLTFEMKADAWQRFIVPFILIVFGLVVWSQRISTSHGFLMDDCHHQAYSYANNFRIMPLLYLPWIPAHRPIGDDAFTLLWRLFGERESSFIWTLLLLHIVSSLFIWLSLDRLTSSPLASLAGASVFLWSTSAYLTIYWPAAIFDLLGTFFLASLLLSVTFIVRPRGEYRPRLLILTLPLLIAAVKTKESMIVVAIPLLLLVFFARLRPKTGAGSSVLFMEEIIERFKRLSVWECAWYGGSIILVITLAFTVQSDFGGTKDVTHPYYSEYSFQVIGQSFAFYLTTLAFRGDYYQITMSSWPAFLTIIGLLIVGVLLRNPWILLGWLWFVLFLLPLAALKNHYANYYYPYPAMIGAALVVAGCFDAILRALGKSRFKSIRFLVYAAPTIFVALIVYQCDSWLKHSSLPQWYDNYHARSAQVMAALKAALPAPPSYANIVLLIREQTQFDQDPPLVLKLIYHDSTLDGTLFREQQQADAYLAEANSRFKTLFLAAWKGNEFDVKYVAYH